MERQFDRGTSTAKVWTLLGFALCLAGCAGMENQASEPSPGSSRADDLWIGVSRMDAAPPLDSDSAPSAGLGMNQGSKPVPPALAKRPMGERVQAPFPSAVGGFDWWQSMWEFRSTCRRADGSTKREGENGIVCSLAPIDGFPVSVDLASGTFCEGRLCATTLVFYRGDLTATYDKVHAAILAKYGNPQADVPRDDAHRCPMMGESVPSTLDASHDSALYWFWESAALGLSVGCDDNGSTVEVTYLTQEALQWGAQQNRRRQQSY